MFCFQLVLVGLRLSLLALFLFKNMALHLLMCGESFKENIPKLDSQLCFSKECSGIWRNFPRRDPPRRSNCLESVKVRTSDHLHFGANKKASKKEKKQKLHIQNVRVVWGTQVGLEIIPSHERKKNNLLLSIESYTGCLMTESLFHSLCSIFTA